jgi:DNA invertase Pin-like site-specific DNA recombinase
MNAVKPRTPFQVLIMSEESRFGREQIETAYALKQLMSAGVRVFFYLEDRERVLETAMDKVMLSLTNFASEMERERGRLRTRDAMHRKASHGHVAGGKVYGYRNREVLAARPDGQHTRDHVVRDIVPEEAAIIRRIFEEIAQGRGFCKVAKSLNADSIPCPAHGRGWATSGVREIAHRALYRGRIVWGKTRWVDRGGTKVKETRPEAQWLVLEAPELRIVPEDLWRATQARLEQTAAEYRRLTDGRLVGQRSARRRPATSCRALSSAANVAGGCTRHGARAGAGSRGPTTCARRTGSAGTRGARIGCQRRCPSCTRPSRTASNGRS